MMGSQPIRIQLRKILGEILVGKSCRKILWEIYVGNAAGNLVGNLLANIAEKVLMVCNGSKNGKKPLT